MKKTEMGVRRTGMQERMEMGEGEWMWAPQVLAWGLRGLRGRSLLPVRAPSLEVQCGGQILRIPPITDLATNPNFPINAFLLTLVSSRGWGSGAHPWVLAPRGDGVAWSQHLPVEEEYVPPIRLRVLDTQGFGYRPHVGQACVQDLARFRREPDGEEQLPRPRVPVPGPNPGTTLSPPLLVPAPSLPIHTLSLGASTPSLSLPHSSYIPAPSLALLTSHSYSYPCPHACPALFCPSYPPIPSLPCP